MLDAIKAADGDSASDIAFALDRSSLGSAGGALEWAMAASRQTLPRGARLALVSCGNRDGHFSTRLEAPFGSSSYQIQRDAGRMEHQSSDGTSVGVSWMALDEASRLDWRAGARRHVILVTDDRAEPLLVRTYPAPRADAGVTSSVTAWAHGSDVSLHLIRYAVSIGGLSAGPRPEQSGVEPPGPALHVIAGLFETATHAAVGTEPALAHALEDTFAVEGAGVPAEQDVALVIDRRVLTAHVRSTLDKAINVFVKASGHQVALVLGGDGKPTLADFTRSPHRLDPPARSGPATSPTRRWDLFGALAMARQLQWRPAATKTVLIVTAASALGSQTLNPLLDWTDSERVRLVFVEPTGALIADWK